MGKHWLHLLEGTEEDIKAIREVGLVFQFQNLTPTQQSMIFKAEALEEQRLWDRSIQRDLERDTWNAAQHAGHQLGITATAKAAMCSILSNQAMTSVKDLGPREIARQIATLAWDVAEAMANESKNRQ